MANWSARWFGKAKFHILLHILEHIRRFGPAILFATESFESFNALIRNASVFSNRQAPSRDIARTFSAASRLRHLMSGGMFPVPVDALDSGPLPTDIFCVAKNGIISAPGTVPTDDAKLHVLRSCGAGPQSLMSENTGIAPFLGLGDGSKDRGAYFSNISTNIWAQAPALHRRVYLGGCRPATLASDPYWRLDPASTCRLPCSKLLHGQAVPNFNWRQVLERLLGCYPSGWQI